MMYRQLGHTDFDISILCLGTMNFGWSVDEQTAFRIMDMAVDAGITCFDTADLYSSWVAGNHGGEAETILGKWLKTHPRNRVAIATKVRGRMWEGADGEGLSRAHIMRAAEDSLRRLQIDTIDLYQLHYPDDDAPLEETFSALDALVHEGKVRAVGVSNFPEALLQDAVCIGEHEGFPRFDSVQPHYSLLHRSEYECELEALCREQEISVLPYSPLAAGFLTGKYSRADHYPDSARTNSRIIRQLCGDEMAFIVLDEVERIAAEHEVPVGQVALAWLLARDTITSPIIGARSVEQLEQLLGAVELVLTPDEIGSLNHLTERY